jgi:hypothetical protein
MSSGTDITNSSGLELRAEVLRRGARLWRLEVGTLMMRNPDTLETQFFLDEEDALGQFAGKPPKRRRRDD